MYQILNYDGKLLAKTSNISYPYTCFYYMYWQQKFYKTRRVLNDIPSGILHKIFTGDFQVIKLGELLQWIPFNIIVFPVNAIMNDVLISNTFQLLLTFY